MHVEHKTAMTDREKSNPETDESLPIEGNETESSDQSETLVRIVAIGASAGGLEPIEQFFDNMSIDTGLAFVIIQHLSPNFQSMMDQLIERHTNMKVVHAEDGMHIDPNVIYLNPPARLCRSRMESWRQPLIPTPICSVCPLMPFSPP